MIYLIFATVVADVWYKARTYGRADIADVIIGIAALAIIF